MHRISMLLSSFFLAASFAATSAQAANSINITSSSCSGTELRDFTGDAIFSCSGDYSFLGGSIGWDSKVSFVATGNLLFDNFDITAKNALLKADGSVTYGGGGTLTVSDTITIESSLGIAGNQPTGQIPNLHPGPEIIIWEVVVIGGNPGNPPTDPCAGSVTLVTCNPATGTLPPAQQTGKIIVSGSGKGIVTAGSGGQGGSITITSSVPEPSTYAMLLAGLLMLAEVTKRRKAKV